MLRPAFVQRLRGPASIFTFFSPFILGYWKLAEALNRCNNQSTLFPWSDRVHFKGTTAPTVHFAAATLRDVYNTLHQRNPIRPVGGSVFEIIKGQLPCPAYFDVDMFIPSHPIVDVQSFSTLGKTMAEGLGIPAGRHAETWLTAVKMPYSDALLRYGLAWIAKHVRSALTALLKVTDVGPEFMSESCREHKFSVHLVYPQVLLISASTSGAGLAADVGVYLLAQAVREVRAFAPLLHTSPATPLPVAHVWGLKMSQLHRTKDGPVKVTWRPLVVADPAVYSIRQQLRVLSASKLNNDDTLGPRKRVLAHWLAANSWVLDDTGELPDVDAPPRQEKDHQCLPMEG
ncbi:hypothetical protein V8C86DRAFT_2445198 [Haematococcus lacustris]